MVNTRINKTRKERLITRIGQDIHAKYAVDLDKAGTPDWTFSKPWDDLGEKDRDTFVNIVRHAMSHIRDLGYDFIVFRDLMVPHVNTRLHCRRADGAEFSIAPIDCRKLDFRGERPMIREVVGKANPGVIPCPMGMDGQDAKDVLERIVTDAAILGAHIVATS